MSEQTCAKCARTAIPTPQFDFYRCDPVVWPNADEKLCETCFFVELRRCVQENKI